MKMFATLSFTFKNKVVYFAEDLYKSNKVSILMNYNLELSYFWFDKTYFTCLYSIICVLFVLCLHGERSGLSRYRQTTFQWGTIWSKKFFFLLPMHHLFSCCFNKMFLIKTCFSSFPFSVAVMVAVSFAPNYHYPFTRAKSRNFWAYRWSTRPVSIVWRL